MMQAMKHRNASTDTWRSSRRRLCAVWLALPLAAASAEEPAPSFTRDIKGILSNRCLRCHGPDPEGPAADEIRGITRELVNL